MKKILTVMYALLAITVFSTGISMATGFDPLAIGVVSTVLSFIPAGATGVAFTGLNKEIWLPEIMEGFYSEDMFLSEARDMSAFVENDIIHLAEAGVNPNVLLNNTTYPIAVAERTDSPLSISLDFYDTENTLIRNANNVELSYDKRASVLYGHRQALKMYFLEKAAHSFAPSSDATLTPVFGTNTVGKFTFEDILKLAERFDNAEIDSAGRVLVLSVTHMAQLRADNIRAYKELLNEKTMYGFKIYSLADKRMPKYNSGTGVKVAFGIAPAPTDAIVSFAFHKDEVMRADGSLDMFEDLKSPTERGDIVGFQKRGVAMPIRNKGIAAIYTSV